MNREKEGECIRQRRSGSERDGSAICVEMKEKERNTWNESACSDEANP